MLAGGTDGLYRAALSRPHTQYVKVEVLDGAGNVLPLPPQSVGQDGGLLIGNGSVVNATLSSRVTRRLTITVDQSLYPAAPTDLLAPYGNRLRVTYGLQFADGGRYAWTVFTGRIQRPWLTSEGIAIIPAADRAYEVAEAGFLVPENSQVGNTINAEFIRLVSDAIPDAVFGASDTFVQTVPQLTWESDRAGALDEMATTAGAFWYVLADGSFVQRFVPWTVAGSPVVSLSDGLNGVIIASPLRDREDVYNSITVTGERADGTTPVFAFAEDNNPDSPTYVSGQFGRRHKTIRLQTPQTQGTAQSAANDYLRRSVALQETWTWTMPPDASIELGDVVSLNAYDRKDIIQVVSGFTLPLEVGSMMTVQAHAQVVGLLI
jgi:uncharacterized protein DUF5047